VLTPLIDNLLITINNSGKKEGIGGIDALEISINPKTNIDQWKIVSAPTTTPIREK
jgi:hypothetical protein